MSGFDVDPDSIQKASAAIESAADELDNILTDFVNQLSGVGDPWGTDMLGSLIGGGYTAIEDLAIRTYTSVVEGFDGFVDGLIDMASTYSGTEQTTSTDINALGKQV